MDRLDANCGAVLICLRNWPRRGCMQVLLHRRQASGRHRAAMHAPAQEGLQCLSMVCQNALQTTSYQKGHRDMWSIDGFCSLLQ